MKKHVIEGPGGTRALPLDTPEADKEFRATLNTEEALHWALHYSGTPQCKLSKAWLKANYGTDNLDRIRRMLARKSVVSKSWQDNPLLYAIIIVTLTVSGGVATKYVSQFIPPPAQSGIVTPIGETPQIRELPTVTGAGAESKHHFRLFGWLRPRHKDEVTAPLAPKSS